jgi:hypothetical protein
LCYFLKLSIWFFYNFFCAKRKACSLHVMSLNQSGYILSSLSCYRVCPCGLFLKIFSWILNEIFSELYIIMYFASFFCYQLSLLLCWVDAHL